MNRCGTDDIADTSARRVLRSRASPALPFGDCPPVSIIRDGIVRRLRQASDKAGTAMDIMDANAGTVEHIMERHGVDCLIHRSRIASSAHHMLPAGRERWVLLDWQQDFASSGVGRRAFSHPFTCGWQRASPICLAIITAPC